MEQGMWPGNEGEIEVTVTNVMSYQTLKKKMGYIRAKCPKKGKASSSKQSVQWVEGTASPSMSSVYLEYFNYLGIISVILHLFKTKCT